MRDKMKGGHHKGGPLMHGHKVMTDFHNKTLTTVGHDRYLDVATKGSVKGKSGSSMSSYMSPSKDSSKSHGKRGGRGSGY